MSVVFTYPAFINLTRFTVDVNPLSRKVEQPNNVAVFAVVSTVVAKLDDAVANTWLPN